jgi:hypothetical protein
MINWTSATVVFPSPLASHRDVAGGASAMLSRLILSKNASATIGLSALDECDAQSIPELLFATARLLAEAKIVDPAGNWSEWLNRGVSEWLNRGVKVRRPTSADRL